MNKKEILEIQAKAKPLYDFLLNRYNIVYDANGWTNESPDYIKLSEDGDFGLYDSYSNDGHFFDYDDIMDDDETFNKKYHLIKKARLEKYEIENKLKLEKEAIRTEANEIQELKRLQEKYKDKLI